MSKPLLIVVSAPSGAGKTTLCDRLLGDDKQLVYSISCTTRKPRSSETDGEDYYFLSTDDFEQRLSKGDFIEHATVHSNMYGTLKDTVLDAMNKGESVLMDIDVQGAVQIRNYVNSAPDDDPIKKAFMDIFITIPSLDVLRQRLEGRAEDTSEVIEKRLAAAAEEMSCAKDYMYVIVNDDLDTAYAELCGVVEKEAQMD